MTTTTSKAERDLRLFGGSLDIDADLGGGLPLPMLWNPLLARLVDGGPAALPEMAGIARQALQVKALRVQHVYRKVAADAWEALTIDMLDYLVEHDVVAADGDRWQVGPRLVLNRPVSIGRGHVVLVHNAQDRAEFDQVAWRRRELNSLVASLAPGLPGLRPLDPNRVTKLADDMRTWGWLGGQSIKIARGEGYDGLIIGGRHRIAAVKQWKGWPFGFEQWPAEFKRQVVQFVHVTDAESVLLAALADNDVAVWSDETLGMLGKVLNPDRKPLTPESLRRALSREAKREEIRALLRSDPTQSNRAIARAVGADHHTVEAVRTEVASNGEFQSISPLEANGTSAERFETTGRRARGRKPDPAVAARKAAEAEARAQRQAEREQARADKTRRQGKPRTISVAQQVAAQALAADGATPEQIARRFNVSVERVVNGYLAQPEPEPAPEPAPVVEPEPEPAAPQAPAEDPTDSRMRRLIPETVRKWLLKLLDTDPQRLRRLLA